MDSSLIQIKEKMLSIKDEMNRVKSKQRYLQLNKAYHKLEKQVAMYMLYKYDYKVLIKKEKCNIKEL